LDLFHKIKFVTLFRGNDLESLSVRFISGDIEKIFICIYSYFVVGYLILFTTYGQNFIGLELFTRILLSIGISMPIITISLLLMFSRKKTDPEKGMFHQYNPELSLASLVLSSFFSLFYVIKPYYNFSPINALFIIIFCFIIFWFAGHKYI